MDEAVISLIDDYAKDGGSEVVWHLCSFTKILYGRNFYAW